MNEFVDKSSIEMQQAELVAIVFPAVVIIVAVAIIALSVQCRLRERFWAAVVHILSSCFDAVWPRKLDRSPTT